MEGKHSGALSSARLSMKVGDLVKFTEDDYPAYAGKVGLIIEERMVDTFVVSVDAKVHPFFIHRILMEVVSESR